MPELLVILATGNNHKLAEVQSILGAGITIRSQSEFPDAPKAIEDAPTFSGNALKKALTLARWLSVSPFRNLAAHSDSVWILADDSGLEVDALNGAPGVHSARFAANDKSVVAPTIDSANNEKLLRLLQAVPIEKRTARFRCVLALIPFSSLRRENASPVCLAEESELQTQF